MKVRDDRQVAVFGVAKTSMSEIKEGSYIGVTAMPEPDGTQKALAVHIFPENQRGAAEGFRPWDLRPNSTMTNATVAETVAGTDGQKILVKYKDGEKKVVVPPDTPIVTFRPRRQIRTEAGRQDHHLRRGEEGRRHAGSRPRQCRPRRHHPADVRRRSPLSLREAQLATSRRECAPDDRLRDSKRDASAKNRSGLLRGYLAPRNGRDDAVRSVF